MQILVVPDQAFRLIAPTAGAFFSPGISGGKKYLYLRKSAVQKVSAEILALWTLHESFHMYQYYFLKDKKIYFPKERDTDPVSKETILLREKGAWEFETYIFLQLHPEYKNFACDCNKDMATLKNILRKDILKSKVKTIFVEDVLDYILVYRCGNKAIKYILWP